MSAPKPPTPKKVNLYEGMTSDPEFAAAAKELGYTNVNKDHEVAAVKEHILKSRIEDERRDKSFVKAERQLYKEGILETNDPFTDKESWKSHYIKSNKLKGDPTAQKQANKAYKQKVKDSGEHFIYSDDTDTEWELQKIYDKQYEIEEAKYQKDYEKGLRQDAKKYQKQQKKLQNKADKKYNKQLKQQTAAQKQLMQQMQKQQQRQQKLQASQQKKAQNRYDKQMQAQQKAQAKQQKQMMKQQEKMMKEMMDQPIYNPKQAALPKVQQQARTPDPMPVAPKPAPTMNIPTAPAPEMVSMGNPMGIVKQSSTSRSRSRRRTRGTSSLS